MVKLSDDDRWSLVSPVGLTHHNHNPQQQQHQNHYNNHHNHYNNNTNTTNQQHLPNTAHYKFHYDCQSSVLTYEQVKRLDLVLDQVVPIHGRGNFPTLYVKLKELIRLVKHKLQHEHSIEIRDVRLNGGTANYVLAPENSQYNDLDLIFGTDLSDESRFDVIRDVVLECLEEFFRGPEKKSKAAIKEAYVHKMVKVNDDDRWSLISLGVQQSDANICCNQPRPTSTGSGGPLKVIQQQQQATHLFQQQQNSSIETSQLNHPRKQALENQSQQATTAATSINNKQKQLQSNAKAQTQSEMYPPCCVQAASTCISPSSPPMLLSQNNNTSHNNNNNTQPTPNYTNHYQASRIHNDDTAPETQQQQQQYQQSQQTQQQRQFPNSIELKFVDRMRRKFEFSVDSFQIILDSLTSRITSSALISKNFYPTVIARSEYGDYKEALYHLEKKLIATRSPEEIRGGGLLKYCNLLVRRYRPTNDYQIRTMERYMCSRFFIDFSDLNQQRAKLESYLANHFSGNPGLKYEYLNMLHTVVHRSTVCLMSHELRLTLNMIRNLAYNLSNEQQHQPLQQQQPQLQQHLQLPRVSCNLLHHQQQQLPVPSQALPQVIEQ